MKTHFENFLQKAVHQAKIEELKEKYAEKGYAEKISDDPEDRQFDLLLQHQENGKVIAFEMEMYPIPERTLKALEQMKHIAKHRGYDFRLVTIVRRPSGKNAINWLQNAFYHYLLKNMPDARDQGAYRRYQHFFSLCEYY